LARFRAVAMILYTKLLQHLHRQRAVVPLQQVDGPIPFCRFRRMTTDRIEQDIGIEEMQWDHASRR
jgi:hypothetical protein